ncbi:hypothetical protein [Bacillus andreraoultii]|uniref:hypothetical protein n=1 Tax=Bacillus andreraoultii TaxID=1499685 RepID=UPI00053A8F6B|nr:hypothetical protein [Bacillus andreraoultii]
MRRDITEIAINEQRTLVIAADNSGGIGMKNQDHVFTPYDVVAYYGFRVAIMECMAARAKPISVVVHNFCGEDAWPALVQGVKRGLCELRYDHVPITGSTESNFALSQSALGMIVIGEKTVERKEEPILLDKYRMAVVGSPLVGNEVLNRREDILPLSLFQELCEIPDTIILPVGSKGIIHEVSVMLGKQVDVSEISCDVDVTTSSGPATCCLLAYLPEMESMLKEKCAQVYHPLLFV